MLPVPHLDYKLVQVYSVTKITPVHPKGAPKSLTLVQVLQEREIDPIFLSCKGQWKITNTASALIDI